MMADRDGTALFLSTPVRKNWFYALYQRAVSDDSGRWKAWHATTLDNPVGLAHLLRTPQSSRDWWIWETVTRI